eukprot:scaffold4078_cov68-Phaeocystis_antarctica.AAC.12
MVVQLRRQDTVHENSARCYCEASAFGLGCEQPRRDRRRLLSSTPMMERLRWPGRSLAGACPWACARTPAADPLDACTPGWTIPRTRRRPASTGPMRAPRRRARPANSTRSPAPRTARACRGVSGSHGTCHRSQCRGTRRRTRRCASPRASARRPRARARPYRWRPPRARARARRPAPRRRRRWWSPAARWSHYP